MNLIIWATTLIVSAIAGYLGTFMISKRMSLASGPLSHLALPGVALAFLFNFNPFLGALFFILLGALIVWILRRISSLSMETLTGISFAFGMSLGFLLLPMQHASDAIMGNISSITLSDFYIALTFSLLIVVLVSVSYKQIVLIILSEDLARSMKINIKFYDLLFLLSVALTVAMEVKIVGGIVTIALMILPASTAFNFSKNLKEYFVLSPILGLVSSLMGLFLHENFSLPAGPLIVLCSFLIFIASLVFGMKRT